MSSLIGPGLWEDVGGQVPIIAVEHALRIACKRWRVQTIVADPFRWARSLHLLAEKACRRRSSRSHRPR